MPTWHQPSAGIGALVWYLDEDKVAARQEQEELDAFRTKDLTPDRVWSLDYGSAGRLRDGLMRDIWWEHSPWIPRRTETIRPLEQASLLSLPVEALEQCVLPEMDAADTAARIRFRLSYGRELGWRKARHSRYAREARTGSGYKHFDLLEQWERRCWQTHLVYARVALLHVEDMALPPLRDRRGKRPGLVLSGRIKDETYTATDDAGDHDLLLACEVLDGALYVHRGWAGDMGALVHGRRRYGLPLVPGTFHRHSQQEDRTLLVARGRPLLRLRHSHNGIRRDPDWVKRTTGLDPLAFRIRARRQIPAGTVDGPRDGLVEVALPPVEHIDERVVKGIDRGWESVMEATVWDYEGLDDGGLFGSKCHTSCIGVMARIELPPMRWLTES